MGAPASEDLHGSNGRTGCQPNGHAPLFSEEVFTTLLTRERKRAKRSRKPFALLLLDVSHAGRANPRDRVCVELLVALAASTRETDLWGWYTEGAVLGVILTELGSGDPQTLRDTVLAKVRAALHAQLGRAQAAQMRFSFCVFPEASGPQNGNGKSGHLPADVAETSQEAGGETHRAVEQLYREPRGSAAVSAALRDCHRR